MKVLLVLAHPELRSFNGAMFQTAIDTLQKAGHEVKTSYLYQDRFQPVSDERNFIERKNSDYFRQQEEELYAVENHTLADDILEEQAKVEWCDLMIWQFPLYWFSLPGILKGWVDKIFSMGKFYDNGKIYQNGFSVGKKALLSFTTGGLERNYVEGGYLGVADLVKPIHRGIFEFLGFSVLQPQIEFAIERMSDEERKSLLDNWKKRLENMEKE